MRNGFRRIAGFIFVITALIGIIISLGALAALWVNKQDITTEAQDQVRLLSDTLQTTADGLVLADHSLESSISSITTLQATIEATAKSIDDTTPMVDTLVILAREDLPVTIDNAQLSLVAAQDSAEIIDGLLSFLARLPLVPENLYNPPVPLHQALGNVSKSLESMPQSLETIETSLMATSGNLETIEADIVLIATDIEEINLSMVEARTVVADYQTLIDDLQRRSQRLENNLPGWINSLTIILTFILIWLSVLQLGLLIQGLDLMDRTSEDVY